MSDRPVGRIVYDSTRLVQHPAVRAAQESMRQLEVEHKARAERRASKPVQALWKPVKSHRPFCACSASIRDLSTQFAWRERRCHPRYLGITITISPAINATPLGLVSLLSFQSRGTCDESGWVLVPKRRSVGSRMEPPIKESIWA